MGEGWWVGIRVVQGITISSGGWVGWGAYMGKGGEGWAQCVDLVLEGVGKSKIPHLMGIMHIFHSVGMS